MFRWVVAAFVMVALPAVASAQDADAGKKIYRKCAPCHSVGPGAKNKVGPHLNGVIGRAAGSAEGFKYSKAMKGAGITWDQAIFIEYITSPKKRIPGNKMIFPGIKDELDQEDLFAYIEQFDADGNTK
ncbi:MAG: cytochrome c family protein [Hyphomicrobium sp.]|nr:cytochrome c family protein [Hyphomicrobium sp.]